MEFVEKDILDCYLQEINSCIYPKGFHKKITEVQFVEEEEKIKQPALK